MSDKLFEELKRRKVFKVGAAYLVVAWLAVQGASIGFPAFDAPPWALRIFILVALLGFPVAVVMAWVLESTPDGVQLDPVRKGTKRIVAIAVVLSALAIAWYFKGQPAYRATDVVANILEGSVQRTKDTVRVIVQLIDARTDQHRWAETFDRPLANVFAVQSEVAQTIAKKLNAELTQAEQAALAQPPTTNAKAYEH